MINQRTIILNSPEWWRAISQYIKGYDNIISFHLETTGNDPDRDDIFQIGLVKVSRRRRNITAITMTFRPMEPIPEALSMTTHITNNMVENLPNSSKAVEFLANQCRGNNLIIGFNQHDIDYQLIWNIHSRYQHENIPQFRAHHSIDLGKLVNQMEFQGVQATHSMTHMWAAGTGLIEGYSPLILPTANIRMLPIILKYFNAPEGKTQTDIALRNEEILSMTRLNYIMTERDMDRYNRDIQDHVEAVRERTLSIEP
jgi:hypothetical protein